MKRKSFLHTAAAALARAWRVPALLAALLPSATFAADHTSTWNGTTGNWTDTTKWSTPTAPGTFPNNGSPSPTFDAIQNGGTLTVDLVGGITIQKFSLGGGTLSATQPLNLNDTMSLTGGTLGGTGTVTAAGKITWTGGTIGNSSTGTAVVQANGGVDFVGGTQKVLTGSFTTGGPTLRLGGDSAWKGGNLAMDRGATLFIQSGVTLTTDFDGSLISGGSGQPVAMTNQGTFAKTAGAGGASATVISFATLTNTGAVNVNAGALQFTCPGTHTGAAFTVAAGAALRFSGNTHTLAGTTAINGAGMTVLDGATVSVPSATTATVNTPLTISGGVLGGTGTLLAGGAINWTGGQIGNSATGTAVVQADGGVSMTGPGDKVLTGSGTSGGPTLRLGANSTWSGGLLKMDRGSALVIQSGAEWENTFNGTIQNTGAGHPTSITNQGTFTKKTATGTTTINSTIAFHSNGTVNVNTGTLDLRGGGTHTGTFTAAAGTTVKFGGGTANFNAGTYTADATVVEGASSQLNFNIPAAMNTLGLLGSNDGTQVGLGGTAGTTVTVTGRTTFSRGLLVTSGGILQANGGVDFTTSDLKAFNATTTHKTALRLGANSTWSGGQLKMDNGVEMVIQSGVTLDNSFDGTMNQQTVTLGISKLTNLGTFRKSAGAGTTLIAVNVDNSGLIQVDTGTLNFGGNTRTHLAGSSVTAAAGTTVRFSGGANIYNAGSGYTAAGHTVVESSSSVTFNNNATTQTLAFTAGTIKGTGTLTVSGPMTWSGGQMEDGGITNANGGVILSGGSKGSATRTLNLGGDSSWPSGDISANSGSVWNILAGSTLTTSFDGKIDQTTGAASAFNNAGTFTKSGAGGGSSGVITTFFGCALNNTGTINANSGTILFNNSYTQTAGALVLNGGSVSRGNNTNEFTFQGGKIQGGGTITGAVKVPASPPGSSVHIELGIGTATGILNITGDLFLTSGSKLTFDIGGTTPGTLHDQLTEAGSSAFARNGLILLALANGFENGIQAANTFNLVTSNQTTTGQFANVVAGRVHTIDGRGSFAVNSGTNNVAVTDFAPSTETARALKLNQQMVGYLETPANRWTFTGSAGQQVRLRPVNATAPGVAYTLVGPGGFRGFTYLSEDSGLTSLPFTGTYTLGVVSLNSQAGGSYSFVLEETAQAAVAIGSTFVGTLDGNNQAQIFRITVTEPGALTIALQNAGLGNNVRLYLSRNIAPTLSEFEYQDSAGPGADRSLTVSQATIGDWYVLVYADEVPTPGSFSLDVDLATVALTSVAPSSQATNQPAVLTLYGAGFTPGTTAELVPASGSPIAASSVQINSLSQLTATFAANSVPPGAYGVRVRRTSGDTATLPGAFTSLAAGEGKLETKLIMPGRLGRHAVATLYIEYANTGTASMAAPLIGLVSADPSNGSFITDAAQASSFGYDNFTTPFLDHAEAPILTLDKSRIIENFFSGTNGLPPGTSSEILFLGSGAQPGVLAPGERRTIPVHYLGLLQPWNFMDGKVELKVLSWSATDASSMDWPDRWESMRPPTFSQSAWNAMQSPITTGIETTGSFIQMLSDNARFLHAQGRQVTDVRELWAFEVLQATGALSGATLASSGDVAVTVPGTSLAITRRYPNGIHARQYLGPFGRGWFCYWFTTLALEDADGLVAGADVVRISGSEGEARTFTQDKRNGSYFPGPGDAAKLTFLGADVYELKETNGTATRFRVDGRIDYAEDPNGNRVTASYDGAQRLTGLAHTSGATITLTYNGSGQISQATTSDGRTATYGYTDSNLSSVTTDDGKVTSYTYLPSGAAISADALASITNGGTTRHFTWDAAGRLATTFLGAGEETVAFGRDNAGGVTITQGTDIRSLFFDHRGQLAKTMNALGGITQAYYDLDGNLERKVLPTGDQRQFSWFPNLKPKSITDELGRTTRMEYNHPLSRLTRFIDAKGISTNYSYDAKGNPLTTTYADGSVEQWSGYNAIGFPGSRSNRRGQNLGLTFTSSGLLDRRTFPDGSYVDFDYDARGNPVTMTEHPAIGADKVTTFAYTPATDGDRLRRVTYPEGRFVDYFYDTEGRRSRITDSAGGDTRYEYDGASRLWKLRDAASNVLAEYLYDSAGRLARINKGNGTATTHAYDAAGRLILLANLNADESVHTSFAYTYDERGLRRSATTPDGTWTYTYDATGQLVRATLASTNPSIANQDLRYFYDEVGNRVSTLINGATTDYVSNNLNQYLGIGGIPRSYDADGNLISDGVNTYAYNTLNQLVQVSGPSGVTEHEYNGLGHRFATIVNGQRTEQLLDITGLVHVLAELDTNGLTARNLYGLSLLNRSTWGATGYFDFDGGGSAVSVRQNSGTVLNRYSFEPFGGSLLRTESMVNPFQFAGLFGVQTDASGSVYMRARHYQTGSGQFLQDDPIRLAGGDGNLRRYVGNNPLSFVDPEGTDGETAELGAKIGGLLQDLFDATGRDESASSRYGNALDERERAYNDANNNQENYQDHQDQVNDANQNIQDATKEFGDDLGDLAKKGAKKPGIGLAAAFSGIVSGLLNGGGLLRPPGGEDGDAGGSGASQSEDPNGKLGPAGFGPEGWIAADKVLPYRVNFENIGPGSIDANGDPFPTFATAPAQRVTITDQLEADFDWSTFQWTGFGFGDVMLTPATGTSHYTGTTSMTYNAQTFDVEIEASINFNTGLLTVAFQSIVPGTGLPPDVLTGFLPPEDGTGLGKGFITYTVRAKSNLTTGTEIRNVASIRFDSNAIITTDQVDPQSAAAGTDPDKQALITIDQTPPTSAVTALAATTIGTGIYANWAGNDVGSGIADFDIYVSEDNGPWTLWLDNTSETSGRFSGQAGRSYSFFSVARDHAGLTETPSFTADATTTPQAFTLMTVSTTQATPVSISEAKVLQNATSHLGVPATVDSVPATSANGATMSRNGGMITYSPAITFIGTDTFIVTVSNGTSLMDGTVVVNVAAAPPGLNPNNPPRIEALPGGSLRVSFTGIPGRTYGIQRSTNLLNWTQIAAPVANAQGGITIDDPAPPQPSAFYRIVFPAE